MTMTRDETLTAEEVEGKNKSEKQFVELKQKAIDFIRKTKEREYHLISDYTDEQIERFYENEINLMIGFATEATKELQEENKQLLKEWRTMSKEKHNAELKGAELMGDISTLEQDCERFEKQIEKMKCCYNCKHSRTEYEHCKTTKHEKWELAE